MFNQFLEKAQRLAKNKEPFAIAFVVNRQLPSSGKPGDKAVIEKDGTLTGWIGGGCTRGIVLKEAAAALKDGKPRVVRISPEGPGESRPGVIDYNMTCQSGGMVELYIEPVLPRPHLLILGKSHVAMALSRIGRAMRKNCLRYQRTRVKADRAARDDIAPPKRQQIRRTRPRTNEMHRHPSFLSAIATVASPSADITRVTVRTAPRPAAARAAASHSDPPP